MLIAAGRRPREQQPPIREQETLLLISCAMLIAPGLLPVGRAWTECSQSSSTLPIVAVPFRFGIAIHQARCCLRLWGLASFLELLRAHGIPPVLGNGRALHQMAARHLKGNRPLQFGRTLTSSPLKNVRMHIWLRAHAAGRFSMRFSRSGWMTALIERASDKF